MTISWAAPGQGSVTGYRILRGTDSNSLSAIVQNTDSTATEYTDSTVAAETTYHYAVLALSAGRGRGPVRRRQRHHSGCASTGDGPRSPAQQHGRRPTHHFLGHAPAHSVGLPDHLSGEKMIPRPTTPVPIS